MATFFGSPPFVSHPIVRTQQLSSSSQPPPATPPPPQESSQTISLSKSSQEPKQPLVVSSDKARQSTRGTSADSTDWIASSLTRRFGLGAGLAWAGFLTFGVVSEQIKTRFEVNQQEANTRDVDKEVEVVLPNGIRYYELRVGGGATPRKGDLVVIDIKGTVQGDGAFVDTFGRDKKPLALVVGSRPYSKGMCEGIEIVLRSMKNGGKRRVIVPPELGFGEEGADFGSGFKIPPSATLEYIVEVEKDVVEETMKNVPLMKELVDFYGGPNKDELARGDVPPSIQCYMEETSATELEARACIKRLILETWKKFNKERLEIGSEYPQEFVESVMNFARMGHFMFTDRDMHGNPQEFKPYALSMFVNPIS